MKIPAAERNSDYADLASGIAVAVARAACAAVPSFRDIRIAGFTQRRKSQSGSLADEVVFEVSWSRTQIAHWDVGRINSAALLRESNSRILNTEGGRLKTITPPEWVPDGLLSTQNTMERVNGA